MRDGRRVWLEAAESTYVGVLDGLVRSVEANRKGGRPRRAGGIGDVVVRMNPDAVEDHVVGPVSVRNVLRGGHHQGRVESLVRGDVRRVGELDANELVVPGALGSFDDPRIAVRGQRGHQTDV